MSDQEPETAAEIRGMRQQIAALQKEREHLLAGMANLGQKVEELERERDLALAEARRARK